MPRRHTKALGARTYANYTKENLEQSLQDIGAGLRTQRVASEHYGIPKSTIKLKLKGKHHKSYGRPTVFTPEEEKVIAAHLLKMAEFGFLVREVDLRFIVKSDLENQGRIVEQFKNNVPVPGYDWVKCFLKRNRDLTVRLCSNIKRDRAAVHEIINSYFDNLEGLLEGVSPENIWNYDETNLCDDPGQSKVICKRG